LSAYTSIDNRSVIEDGFSGSDISAELRRRRLRAIKNVLSA